MKFTSIDSYKNYLISESVSESRSIFEAILDDTTLIAIEAVYKTSYGMTSEGSSTIYYIQLANSTGVLVDRISYNPEGKMNGKEWWTTQSTLLEKPLAFMNYNELATWFNSVHETKLPLYSL